MTESVLIEHTDENLAAAGAQGARRAARDRRLRHRLLVARYLHRFPVDVLKIDRSFIDRLAASDQDAELVRTIVRLGQSLGMLTIAEGIETSRSSSRSAHRLRGRPGLPLLAADRGGELIDDMLGETERYSAPPSNVTALSSARKRTSARAPAARAGRRGRCARSPAPRLNASTLASCRSPGGGPPKAPPVRPLNL